MPTRLLALLLALGPSVAAPAWGYGDGLELAEPPAEFDRWDEARRLRYGYGMTARAEHAIRWYGAQARAGDPRAMHNYGLMLATGLGTPADLAEGRRWLGEAFAAGVVESALALGGMERTGAGGPADPARAAAYFRAAAEAGDSRGMHALANLLAAGEGAPASLGEAYVWWSLAAELGHPEAEAARRAARWVMPGAALREAEARLAERGGASR